MVKSVDFAVRDLSGSVAHGMVAGEGASDFIQVGAGDEISLNLRKTSILKYVREGNDLEIVLTDGRMITLSGYYDAGAKLYISSDGELTPVSLEGGSDGVIYADYGSSEVLGKWSPNDQLAFLDGEDILTPIGDDTTGMAMFAPAILGGLGSAGIAGAGLVGVGLLSGGGGGGGGSTGPVIPTVDNPEADATLTTETPDPAAVVSGTGEPGSTVTVVLGDQTLDTTVSEDGTWSVSFEDDTFPSDGDLTATVTVTAPDGTVYDLDGPDFLIDMTPPPIAVTEGAQSTGDVENHAEYQDGITIRGTGEAGASVLVEVAGHTQEATVALDGSWSVTFPTTDLPAGTYTEAMTITSTDIHGNSTTITDTLVVDTEMTLTQTMTPGGADGVVSGAEALAAVMIGGAVEAGSTLVVTLANGQTVPATVTGGSWTAQIPAALMTGEGEVRYTVTATDPNGNVAELPGTVRYDTVLSTLTQGTTTNTTVLNDAFVNKAEGANGVVVTGTIEAGARSVSITLADGTTIPGTISGGSWSATIPAQYVTGEGTLSYSVNGQDAYGNMLGTPISGSVQYDSFVNQFTLNGATGGADGVVNKAEAGNVSVGGTVEAGSSVVLTLADGSKVNATVSGTSWSAPIPASYMSGDGTLSYTVQATDARGNVSNQLPGTVTYDTVLSLTNSGTTTNTTQLNDAIVNKAEGAAGVVLSGTVEAGAQSVTVTLADGSTVNATVSGTSWSATIPSARIANAEGTLNYTVNAVDSHGNSLSSPLAGSVQYDTIVRNFAQTANVATNNVVNATEAANGFAISGTVEPNSDIVVRLESGATRSVHVGTDGAWSVTFDTADLAASGGTVHYTVTATDLAGNVAVLGGDNSLSFTVDLAAPDAPLITDITDDGASTRALYTDLSEAQHYTVAAIGADGVVDVLSKSDPVHFGSEDYYNLGSRVPNGEYLVVTDTDAAGNSSSTLLVVNSNGGVTLDLGHAGLDQFDISSIDLGHADASLSITAEQIMALTGPDHTLTITGDAADHVTAIGAQDTGENTQIGGHTYSIYTLGDDSHLIIDDQITNLTL